MYVIVIILALMIPLLAILLDSQLGRALAGRLERNPSLPSEGEGVEPRVAALEAEIERLAQEVKRLEEETRFTQQLLEGRGASDTPTLPPGGQARGEAGE